MTKIAYCYNKGMEEFHYGSHHPMKPRRIVMTHSLVSDYGLLSSMDCYSSADADVTQMCSFHSTDYVYFLQRSGSATINELQPEFDRYNIDGDCPVFDGLFKFCAKYTGASLAAATALNQGECDVAINWSGGLHHAKKSMASGFCFINDIVIATLELLKYYSRVLYIDIDIHHGDGVQEAFYLTDRVMTLSFHQFGYMFFPGTGLPSEKGMGNGSGYSLNVPLQAGINDRMYHSVFKPTVAEVIHAYQPECIVLQCGADSLDLWPFFLPAVVKYRGVWIELFATGVDVRLWLDMGQEQSSSSNTNASHPSFRIWSRRGRDDAHNTSKAYCDGIVVVNPGNRNEHVDVPELAKLKEIPIFYPILRSNLNIPGLTNPPDIKTKLSPIAMHGILQKLQNRLWVNAERVSSEQRKLCAETKKVDSAIAGLKTYPHERCNQLLRLKGELLRIDSLYLQISKISEMLRDAASLAKSVNSRLPESDRLPDLVFSDDLCGFSEQVEEQRVVDVSVLQDFSKLTTIIPRM